MGTLHGIPFSGYFSDSQCVTSNPAYEGEGYCCQTDNCNISEVNAYKEQDNS